MSSALPQLLRLTRLIISGANLALVHQPPDAQRALQAERDLGLHVGELLLEELRAGERLAELLAVEAVLAGAVPAILRRAHRAPGDAVAGAVEAAERPLEPGDVGQQRVLADLDVLHHDLAGDRRAQRELAADLRRRQALHALLQDEAADLVVVRRRLRPDDEDVGDRRVRDPHLRAVEPVAVGGLLGARLHAARIGAGIGLGQAEAADPFAAWRASAGTSCAAPRSRRRGSGYITSDDCTLIIER